MRGRLPSLAALAALIGTVAAAGEFLTLKGHGGPVMGIAVSPDGQIASASFDNSVGLWHDGVPAWLEGHDAAVTTLAFAGGDRLVSGGDDFAVLLWEAGRPREIGRHRGKVTDIAISPDGRLAASASWDGSVGLWPLDGGAPQPALQQNDGGVNDVAFSPDGKRLYAATSSGRLLVHDLGDGGAPRPLVQQGFGINRMAVSPNGGWIAYGAVDGATRVIDSREGRQIADFTLERRPILALAHHPGTERLAVGDGHGFIMIVDTARWIIERDFRAVREGPVWALGFSPDGQTIYAGGLDSVVYAWPIDLLDEYRPAEGAERGFLREAAAMPNGQRQFMRKCSICHALTKPPSRKAGPTLYGLFGRRAGTVPGYRYSDTLRTSSIVWTEDTVDALFDLGPDHYIPASKMPMQRITRRQDRADLIDFLKTATNPGQ